MKRTFLLSITLIFALCGVLYAQGINGDFDGYNVVKVQYDGVELKPDKVPGILYKGSTLVPLGMLRQAGFSVEWDNKTLTANIKPKKPDKPAQRVLSFDEISKLSDRVALIYACDENWTRKEQGSGFLINSKGLLVTAHHVIIEEGQYRNLEIIVRGKTYKVPAGVTAFEDAKKDIAGVYLYDREPFPYFKIGDLPNIDDKVYAIGNPQGKVNVVTEGKVMDTHKMVYAQEIGFTAKTEPGSSGGVLLNQYGEAIGVTTDAYGAKAMSEVLQLHQQSFNQ